MIDKDIAMQRHAHNLKKSAGLHGNNSVRYEYILTVDQLEDAMLKSVDDLNYPLRKEVKRDRYVLNSKALREAIIKGSEMALNEYQHQIYVFLQNDVNKLIERNAFTILDDVMSLGLPSNRNDDTSH